MEHHRLNAYHIMWLFVMFDLPVISKIQRKRAAQFRKNLEKDGFCMWQYSVYIRHCASKESMEVHIRRLKALVPPEGKISVVQITDKQYGNIINIWGKIEKIHKPVPRQLELF